MRGRNPLIRKGYGCNMIRLKKVERNVLKWFRHIERRVKNVLGIVDNIGRGKPQRM